MSVAARGVIFGWVYRALLITITAGARCTVAPLALVGPPPAHMIDDDDLMTRETRSTEYSEYNRPETTSPSI